MVAQYECTNATELYHLKMVEVGVCGSVETNLIRIHEDMGSIPSLVLWVKNLAFSGAVV